MFDDVSGVSTTFGVTGPATIDSPGGGIARWGKIESLNKYNLPKFPTHVLPAALRDWVAAESEATQTPADLAGLLAVAVCAGIIARKVEVEPRPGWREPVNLFVAVLQEPGNRKSAVFKDAKFPLRELEAKLIGDARPNVAREQSARREKELRLRKLEKRAAETDDATTRAKARDEADKLAEQMACEPEVVLPRLIVDDATNEQLAVMLAEQDGRITSMAVEGDVFDAMRAYSKSGVAQFGVYLKGHAGDDLLTDRISRKSVRVSRPALTCAYAIQPDVIEGLVACREFRGRGLLGRFLWAVPESWIGSREIATTPVRDEVKDAYHNVVNQLAQQFASCDTLIVALTDHAQKVFITWETEIESMLADGGVMESTRDWGAKLAGATLRLAAVLHCVEQGRRPAIDQTVIAAAIEIARYLIPHAEAMLGMMDAKEDFRIADARYLLRWIERHGLPEFSKTEAQHHGKRRFPTAADIDAPLAELVKRNYIRAQPSPVGKVGRQASPVYEVNPALFADGRRSRNSGN